MYSNSTSSSVLRDKQGSFLFSYSDQLNRFAEHYSELASDVTQHSLDNEYWVNLFGTNSNNNPTWDINDLEEKRGSLPLDFFFFFFDFY